MPKEKDSQSRKWQLTINNPAEKGYTHDFLKQQAADFKSLAYWCMCDEVGENGTPHTHLYIAFRSPVRFSTLKNHFDGAHFEIANGTSEQNRDYVRKEGKWADDEKHETNLPDTFEEYGEMPVEHQGKRTDLTRLYELIKDGTSNYDIIEENPSYMLKLDKIERARQIVREERFRKAWRDLEVSYIFGKTGAGKTRGIMERYGYENVYRVTDYDHPFDSYAGQDVIVFEEFRSSLKINEMLNYLDGYPLELPCRYCNRVACFTKVYVITNIPFERQYESVQLEHPETWKAFIRRFQTVREYTDFGVNEYPAMKDYFRRNQVVYTQGELPF